MSVLLLLLLLLSSDTEDKEENRESPNNENMNDKSKKIYLYRNQYCICSTSILNIEELYQFPKL